MDEPVDDVRVDARCHRASAACEKWNGQKQRTLYVLRANRQQTPLQSNTVSSLLLPADGYAALHIFSCLREPQTCEHDTRTSAFKSLDELPRRLGGKLSKLLQQRDSIACCHCELYRIAR
eukprot:1028156-Pleurochrysis_carterae.AAC.1